MTAPAPLPAPRSFGEDGPQRSSDMAKPGSPKHGVRRGVRAVRLAVVLGVAAALLLGALGWLVVWPYFRVRAATERCMFDNTLLPGDVSLAIAQQEVTRLGGPEKARGALIVYLKLPRRLAPCRSAAPIMLGLCGRESVPALIALLRDEDSWTRANAALALGRSRDARALPPLLGALRNRDEDDFVRMMSAVALGHLGDSSALEPLVTTMRSDRSVHVRRGAAFGLGLLGEVRARDALVAMLNDRTPSIRVAAIWALGRLGDPQSIEPLRAAARNAGDEETARAVIEALRQIESRTSPQLIVPGPEAGRAPGVAPR